MIADLTQILKQMLEFQKLNNSKSHCITNVQFLYDVIKPTYSNVKAVPVIAISENEDLNTLQIIHGHLILIITDGNKSILIEPSYEIKRLPNLHYFYNIKDYIKSISDLSEDVIKLNIKSFLKFKQNADKINNNIFCIDDKLYYDNQANYIEKKLNIQITNINKLK